MGWELEASEDLYELQSVQDPAITVRRWFGRLRRGWHVRDVLCIGIKKLLLERPRKVAQSMNVPVKRHEN